MGFTFITLQRKILKANSIKIVLLFIVFFFFFLYWYFSDLENIDAELIVDLNLEKKRRSFATSASIEQRTTK